MPALDLSGKQIVLLLQGGGALGAYQVGAFKALSEHTQAKGVPIDWVAGISIGAINSSVIAGHRGADAFVELQSLWEDILSPAYPPSDCSEMLNALRFFLPNLAHFSLVPKYAAWNWTALNGQPNFFTSRLDPLHNPWLLQWAGDLQRDQLALYDTAPLRQTLEKHVDFESLQKPGATRLSLGAARVCDGEVEFFDSQKGPLTADHVMASGALPPAFPPIEINGEWYFDGGVSSNTPIEVLQHEIIAGKKPTFVFIVDVWDRKSETVPRTMDELVWRQKSIQFGSRKKAAERVVRLHEYMARAGHDTTRLEVCQVMLEHDARDCDFCFSDANFLRSSYEMLSLKGERDIKAALRDADLVTPPEFQFSALYRYGSAHKHRDTDPDVVMPIPLCTKPAPVSTPAPAPAPTPAPAVTARTPLTPAPAATAQMPLAPSPTAAAQVPLSPPSRRGVPLTAPKPSGPLPSASTAAEPSSRVHGPKPEIPALTEK